MSISHFGAKGQAVMVDVSGKKPTLRIATAGATVKLKPETVAMIVDGRAAKGDVLSTNEYKGKSKKKCREARPVPIWALPTRSLAVFPDMK
jgi:cyclic pyranopterin phosphate synthase